MTGIHVSVIVPIYNVEPYIERCVRSLFEQTMTDGIEFVFVNDATPDRSMEVLRRVLCDYPRRVPQVRLVEHEQNRGLPETRLSGLRAAGGEYVIHVDSDDWMDRRMCELMYAEAKRKDADIVGCDYMIVMPRGTKYMRQDFSLPRAELLINMAKDGGKIMGYFWIRMIRRSFYLEGDYRATPNISLCEDLAVTIPLHFATDKVAYLPMPLYFYNRTVKNSMSSVMDEARLDSVIEVETTIKARYSMQGFDEVLNRRIQSHLLACITKMNFYDPKLWQRKYKPMADAMGLPLTVK